MRLAVGMKAPNFVTEALDGHRVDLASLRGRTVLLKFYRFATCPVCNWHMQAFIHEYRELEALGLTTLVFFHSPGRKIQRTRKQLAPFSIVPDPAKQIFTAYGVEQSWAGMFSMSVWATYARALAAGYPVGMLTADGGVTGNPADFIIDADGRIAFAHYGKHYADALGVQQIAEIRRGLDSQPTPLRVAHVNAR